MLTVRVSGGGVMLPTTSTALDYIKSIYEDTLKVYTTTLREITEKGRVSFTTDELIKSALRTEFYAQIEMAYYYWSGKEVADALYKMEIRESDSRSLVDKNDTEDSFLSSDHVENYEKALRKEARRKSRSKK